MTVPTPKIDLQREQVAPPKEIYQLASRNATASSFEKPVVSEEVVITGYCPCSRCCGKSDGITASGVIATEGKTIAADISKYSFGTVLYLEGIGFRTVEDRGGAIKGNRLDLYFESHEDALQFGKQTIKVEVIK